MVTPEIAYEGQQILENIYLGGIGAAMNTKWLRNTKITHVLDCGSDNRKRQPDLKYLEFWLMQDDPDQELNEYFDRAHAFIDEGNKAGAVLVHCRAGSSRSAAILISYLMAKRGYSFDDALKLAQSKRWIVHPNSGFVKQLKSLKTEAKS